eukprot:7208091-Pyramimonas_sp.AAC.1
MENLDKKKGFIAKVKSGLSGRAWALCYKDEKISVEALAEQFQRGNAPAEKEAVAGQGLDVFI